MKNVCLNKKGFTLVELLAVIVILALLIVITANTILPMLGRTKETGMTTYAKRVLNNALTNLEADKIVGKAPKADAPLYYKIYADLTKNKSYYGCVKVELDRTGYKYSLRMFTTDDSLYMSVDGITDVTSLGTPTVTKEFSLPTGKVATDVEALCATKFDKMDAADPLGNS